MTNTDPFLVRSSVGKRANRNVAAAALVVIVVALLMLPFMGWLLMLAIGGLHSGWIPAIPTIGYGSAVLLAWFLGLVGACMRGSGSKKN